MVGTTVSTAVLTNAKRMDLLLLDSKQVVTAFVAIPIINMEKRPSQTATWLLLGVEMVEADGEMQSMKQVTKAVGLMPLQEP